VGRATRSNERLPHLTPTLSPLGAERELFFGIQHNVATGHSWKLRRKPGSGQSIAANWPVPERVM
jgi:hypothetical protein